jgi:H+/Cl- antiporter ClcA
MNAFLISAAVMIVTTVTVMSVWMVLVFLVLGLFGIRVPMRLHKRLQTKAWQNRKELSKPWRVFVSGVVLGGLPVGTSLAIYNYLNSTYFDKTSSKMDFSDVIAAIVIFSAVSIWMDPDSRKAPQDSAPSASKD